MSFGLPANYSAVNNNFDIAQQFSLRIVSPQGTVLADLGLLTEFTSSAPVHAIEVKGINNGGYIAERDVPERIKGSFAFARRGGIGDLLATVERGNYFAGNAQNSYSILETVRENDGTLSEYQYIDVRLGTIDLRTIRQDAEIPMKVEFSAADYLQVAGETTSFA